MERVEVLHGANVIHGLGAVGGVINLITKRPAGQIEQHIKLDSGFQGEDPAKTVSYGENYSFSSSLGEAYVLAGITTVWTRIHWICLSRPAKPREPLTVITPATGHAIGSAIEPQPSGKLPLSSSRRVALERLHQSRDGSWRGYLAMTWRVDELSAGRRALNQLYPLHSGYGMPLGYGLLLLLGAVTLVWLGYSGFTHWLVRNAQRR